VKKIVIIGGGPVGLTTALTLARAGIRSLILEADEGFCTGSRAICISRRSLEIFEALNVVQPFLEKGLPWHEGVSYLGLEPVFYLDMPKGKYPPFINLQQYYVEEFLTKACLATGLVEINYNTPVASLMFDYDVLVAADGARSFVREAMGLKLQGKSYASRYLIADITLKIDWPTQRKVWFDPPANKGSTVIMHKQPDDMWRIDMQMLPHEDEVLDEERVKQRIQQHLDFVKIDVPWKLVWHSVYRAHTLSLENYSHGNVHFAGDAAHLVPIFGVRGLNSGIEDAYELAQGLIAGDMSYYSPRRKAAYEENIAQAAKSTWFMSPPTKGFELARDVVLRLAVKNEAFRPLINPRQAGLNQAELPLEQFFEDFANGYDAAGEGEKELFLAQQVFKMAKGLSAKALL
jgi:3-(3-hydroxy-phenyl)propionate hydroxylase